MRFENCVILAGGKSSRMGQDKTLLPFGGEVSLAHYLFKKMQVEFENVYVSSKFQKFLPPLNLIQDDVKDDFSPMLALYSILSKFKKPIFIIPADMPFVKYQTIQTLGSLSDKYDVVVAKDRTHRHSLCGFFSPSIAHLAKELYEKGSHKIGILLDLINLKEIEFIDENQFFNINYPDDYKKALDV